VAPRRSALQLAGSQLESALRHGVTLKRHAGERVIGRFTPAALRARVREATARLEGLSARLESASYPAVLARGYVLVSDAAGTPVTRAAEVRPGQGLNLRFADGEVKVRSEPAQGRLLL
jgi:exodeoxyribonuclease VII large subunit